jgi:hypothetical protein
VKVFVKVKQGKRSRGICAASKRAKVAGPIKLRCGLSPAELKLLEDVAPPLKAFVSFKLDGEADRWTGRRSVANSAR